MAAKRCRNEQSENVTGTLPAADLPEQQSEEIQISYQPHAHKSRGGSIHPRLPAPAVPEGEAEPDLTPSPPVNIEHH